MKLALLLAAAALLVAGLSQHAASLNGSIWWFWWWRWLPPVEVFTILALCAAPLFLGLLFHGPTRLRTAGALALITLSALTLQVGSRWLEDKAGPFDATVRLVTDGRVNSYYSDARDLMDESGWLRSFHERSPDLHLHSRTHPPGVIVWNQLWLMLGLDERHTALLSALGIALLAALAVPATWWLARALGADDDAAMFAAALLALMPGVVLFAPIFDPVYAAFAAWMMGSWARALQADRMRWAIGTGMALGLGAFFTYSLLTLGTWFVGLAALRVAIEGPETWKPIARQVGLVAATLVVGYAALWAVTGFDPVRTFFAALDNQAALAAKQNRPWPTTIPSDLVDFARGAAFLPALLAGYWIFDRATGRAKRDRLAAVVALGLGQVLVVAFSGLLRVETARVWAFLLPLLALPAGLELARWKPRDRWLAFAALWLVFAACHLTMLFPMGAIHPDAAPPR